MDRLYRARLWRGHLHCRLIALQGDDWVVPLELLTGADMYLDDGDILKVTDCGNADLDRGHGYPGRWLQNERADVGQDVGKPAGKTGSERAVNDPMIVGEAERQHKARLEGLAVPDGLHRRAYDAEDGELGCVDNGSKVRPADAAQA